MYFCSGQPMHFCCGVDNRRKLKTALGGDWSGAEVDRVRRRLELPAYAYINRYGAAIWLALIVAGMLIGTLLHYVWPI
jgi:hypothetical protein